MPFSRILNAIKSYTHCPFTKSTDYQINTKKNYFSTKADKRVCQIIISRSLQYSPASSPDIQDVSPLIPAKHGYCGRSFRRKLHKALAAR